MLLRTRFHSFAFNTTIAPALSAFHTSSPPRFIPTSNCLYLKILLYPATHINQRSAFIASRFSHFTISINQPLSSHDHGYEHSYLRQIQSPIYHPIYAYPKRKLPILSTNTLLHTMLPFFWLK